MKKCLWLLASLLFVSGCTSDDASSGKDGGGDTGDIVCESGEHVYADECEADSLTSCGSHDNDCAKLEGWKAGDCTGGKCVASECADGYELKDGVCASGAASPAECGEGKHSHESACEDDSLENCGGHGNDCAKQEGWKAGACTGGKCVPSECAENYELKDGACVSGTAATTECEAGKHAFDEGCEDDSDENCGSHGNKCADLEGWKAGACTDGKCVATECAENFELKEGKCEAVGLECEAGKHAYGEVCEDDSLDNCGSHDNKCAELEGWKAGDCTDGKCVASECAENFELKEGKCEAAGSECEAGKHAHEGGCEDDSDENCGSHGNKCADLEGWKDGNCTEGKCVASECEDGYKLNNDLCVKEGGVTCNKGEHVYGNGCEADTVDNCGKHGNSCLANSGWYDAECSGGTCKLKQCKQGLCIQGDACVEGINNNSCGTDGNACVACNTNQTCSKGTCIDKGAPQCKADQHVWNGKCEDDSLDNCGKHGYQCESAVEGWNSGNCVKGVCKATKCKSGYCISSGACIAGLENKSACGIVGNQECAVCGQTEICSNGVCVGEITCAANQHQYGNVCEDDTVENCGSHGNDCSKAEGWLNGSCTNKKCIPGKCKTGYCINQLKKCVAGMDDVNACGIIGKQCLICAPNEICDNGQCIDNGPCAANQHKNGSICEDDTVENCGSHGNDCSKAEGWLNGSCTNKKCVPSMCKSGYCINKQQKCVAGMDDVNACGIIGKQCLICASHETCDSGQCIENVTCAANQHKYGNICEDDTVENCGSHGKNCAESVAGWQAGSCSNKKCVVTRCQNSYCIKNGGCVDGMSNVNACGGIGKQCIVCDANQTCSSGICKDKEIKCAANQHVWNGGCENDDVNNCGEHGKVCTKVAHAASMKCESKTCKLNKCVEGYTPSGNVCVSVCPDSHPYYCSGGCCAKASCTGACIN